METQLASRRRVASKISYSTRPEGRPVEWETFRQRKWRNISAQYCRLNGPVEYSFLIAGNSHRFVLLDEYAQAGEIEIAGLKKVASKNLRDKFLYAGPGAEISGWSRIEKPSSIILVELADGEQPEPSVIPPIYMRADALTRSVLLQFKRLLLDEGALIPNDLEPDYAESLGVMLVQEAKRLDCKRTPAEDADLGLTSRQMRAVVAYMDDRLDQDISIAQMAQVVGMSPFHFCRMFKRSADQPPYRFFLDRRVRRAKDLLRLPYLSVSDVAEMTGFGGTTQLTRSFRRIVGTTPSAFRKEFV